MRPPRTRPRLRKVYLLPNLFTAFNLFLGVLALMAVFDKDTERACWFILLASVLDGLDGLVARLTHTQSEFGLQFDSLSDLVSFGVAPAIAMFTMLEGLGSISHRAIVGVCALYAICGALRLARYNVQAHGEERQSFTGLPIPAGAAMMVFSMLSLLEYKEEIRSMAIPVWFDTTLDLSQIVKVILPFIVLATALLMVSEIPYPKILAKIRFHRRMSFDSLVSLILVIILMLALKSDLRVILLFLITITYILYGVVNFLAHQFFPHKQPEQADAGGGSKN